MQKKEELAQYIRRMTSIRERLESITEELIDISGDAYCAGEDDSRFVVMLASELTEFAKARIEPEINAGMLALNG